MKNIFLTSLLLLGALASCTSEDPSSKWSKEEIFGTYPVTATAPEAKDTYDTQVTLSGAIVEEGSFTKAGFYLSEEPFASNTDGVRYETETISAEGEFSVLVDELTAETVYLVRPFAQGAEGELLGKVFQVTTLAKVDKLVVVKETKVNAIDAKSATVNIMIDEESGAPFSAFREFGIRYWAQGSSEKLETKIAMGESGFSYNPYSGFAITVSGLLPNTNYEGEFYSRISTAEGVYHSDKTFVIDCPDLAKPALADNILLVGGGSFLSLQTTITSTGNDANVIYGYRISSEGEEEQEVVVSVEGKTTLDGAIYSHQFSGLKPDTQYKVTAFIKSTTLMALFPDDPSQYEITLDFDAALTKTSADNDALIALADISLDNYPTADHWIISSDAAPAAPSFAKLKAVLAAIDPLEGPLKLEFPDLVSMPNTAMNNQKAGAEFEMILENATSIGNNTFQNSTKLVGLTLHPYVVIGNFTFQKTGLRRVDFCEPTADDVAPKYISIGNNCFDGCKSLPEELIFPYHNTFGNWPFNGCSSVYALRLPRIEYFVGINFANGGSGIKVLELATETTLSVFGGQNMAGAIVSFTFAPQILISNYDNNGTTITDNTASGGKYDWGVKIYNFGGTVYTAIPPTADQLQDYTYSGFSQVFKTWDEYKASL